MLVVNAGPGVRLRGRHRECATLRALVSDPGPDTGRVLVVRGEAGVGKSALLDYVAHEASGFRCTQVAGVESDMELAFAALQQLCAPLLGHVDELPAPQRHALDVAFGRGVGPTPDRFLVGLAVLSLMAAAAESRPLLCIVDDAQWLDQVSLQTLGFVARRLLAEPVAIVFAVRGAGADVLAGLPEMLVAGLADGDARKLLDSVVLGRLDDRVRDRIIAETRGNPLALVQVPRNVSAAELAGGFGHTTAARPSAGHVEKGFARRIRSLPAATRRLLLVAAAEPVGDASLFLRAAEKLGIPVDQLGPAEAADVIQFGTRIRFHHPLVRSAAYRTATLADRREVHRVLAEATDPETDPDRRAWHAANAAAGPDDEVADDLESSAWRAQRRGGIAAAATFLERATALTADPARRGVRAIAAAQAKCDAAAPEAAYELLSIADLAPLSELHRAQVVRLRAQMQFSRSRGGGPGAGQVSDAAAQLRSAAEQLEGLDDELSRDTHLEALAASMYASRCGDPTALVDAAEAARRAVERITQLHRPIDHLLSGLADLLARGLRDGAGELRTALRTWRDHAERKDGRELHWLSLAFPIVQESCASELWDDDLTHALSDAMVRYARDVGALAMLPPALSYRAGIHILSGELSAAATLLDEAEAIAVAINYRPLKYHRLHLTAWQGVPDQALPMIESATEEATSKGEGRLLGLTGFASAILYNGLGRYADAFDAARRTCEDVDLGFHGWCLMELIEAAAHTDERDVAEDALQRLEHRTVDSGTQWGLGALAAAQALLADNEQADALFTEAIERLDRTRVVLHAARTRLRYGEWLRRMNRRPDARSQLGDAHDMFTRFGAQAYAERARRELIAVGEKVRRQPTTSGDELTAQESQIAHLAADGFTNQEIGAQLFISAHTVEWHLRKVFVKLGVTSRRQLRTITWPG